MRELIPFILPAIGLFWAVVGARQFLTSAGKRRKSVERGETTSETEPSKNKDDKSRSVVQRGRRRLVGLCWFITGIVVLWQSDIRIGTSSSPVAQSLVPDHRLADIVTRQVEREFAKKSHVGLVVGVVADNQESVLGFGRCRVGDQSPTNADTVFEIGSISKVFTGILLAQRVESGELEVDDRIADLLPEGWTLPNAAKDVTLQHCTTHTSGFPRLPANQLGIANAMKLLFGGDPYQSYREDEFQEAVSTLELDFDPGTEHRYSNFAVSLLGHILATRDGTDYETLLKRRICEPLGMQSTMIDLESRHQERMAAGYRASLKIGPVMLALESAEWQLPTHLAGAGAIRSTGGDMLTFLKANMGVMDTPIQASIQRSHQELFRVKEGRAIGMNWIRSFDPALSQHIIWHNGGTGGYRSYLGFTKDGRFGVVVLSNTAWGVDQLGKGILGRWPEDRKRCRHLARRKLIRRVSE